MSTATPLPVATPRTFAQALRDVPSPRERARLSVLHDSAVRARFGDEQRVLELLAHGQAEAARIIEAPARVASGRRLRAVTA